jgi:hypothetical protein
MSKILKRTSFGLLRTNPKLTTNIKIITDSKDKVYLETFDADPLLTKSKYKGFEVTGGSYSWDLNRFYSQGNLLPKSIAYTLFEEDESIDIKNKYNEQFDFTYAMGMQPKNSRIYKEEFSLFCPLWVEQDNIPDYFLIFKIDGPVTFNSNDGSIVSPGTNLDTNPSLNDLVINPEYFFENYIKKSKIIKTFDLTDKSAIGSYIRRHANDTLFPESSFYASFEKGDLSYWQGISYDSGGFCRKAQDIYTDYVLIDKTVTENDDFITMGFFEQGVVHPNILNLEFLFDDIEQEKYKFSRYFGLYVSEAELGKFTISSDRLYEDRDNEVYQIPRPLVNDIGSPILNTNSSQIQTNERGIKIYPLVSPTGPSSTILPYSGRLIDFNETQNPRIPYVKDVLGNFYSINQTNGWDSTFYIAATGSTTNPTPYIDSDYLRIKNTTVDWNNFSGLDDPFVYIPAYVTDKKGKAGFSFQITDEVYTGDEIRIKYTDWNDPIQASNIDNYTIRADAGIPRGTNQGLVFSTLGNPLDVANAISSSINEIKNYATDYQIFRSVAIGDTVIVYVLTESTNWNKIEYSLFSIAPTFPFTVPEEYSTIENISYLPSPVSLSIPLIGNRFKYHFNGSNPNPRSRIVVEKDYVLEFYSDIEPIYVKTDRGYDTTEKYSLYLDKPIKNKGGDIIGFDDFDKYYVVELSDTTQSFSVNSSQKIGLYKTKKNTNGYLSMMPVKDFDFDSHDESYSKDADSSYSNLLDWYTGITGPSGEYPGFIWNNLSPGEQDYFYSIIGPTSSFAIGGGFQKLSGMINDYDDTNELVVNEYGRLKENILPELALSSKVVPFINKWVYDNECVDVRENNYRLNTDQAFGYSNFSPSFDEFNTNSKFFTHEWYYLQKYPPYMSFDEKVNSFSYFEDDLYFPQLPLPGSIGSTAIYNGLTGGTGATANLLSINEDYFLSYFTRETVNGISIPRDFKYSLFENGSDEMYSETLFRGAKVNIKDRSENSPINYNIESLKFIPSSKYDKYKFSAILTYNDSGTQINVIKNDKWKSVTVVIQANIADPVLSRCLPNNTRFIDRSLLYTMQHALEVGGTGGVNISNINLSGQINDFTNITPGHFDVFGGIDENGNSPDFFQEIVFNEDGGYNNISVGNISGYYFEFVGIYAVTANSFKCTSILTNCPTGGSILTTISPGGGNSYTNLKYSVWGLPYYTLWSQFDAALNSTINYFGGGWNAYQVILNNISFARIADHINSGDPEIRYINVTESGNIEFNTFVIELLRPDVPIKSTYLKAIPIRRKPIDLQTAVRILGYEMVNEERLNINQISRYRGNYNPRWRDVFKFVDTNDIKNEGLDYNNIQILTINPNDPTYTQIVSDSNLGLIKNLHFNKVNVENPNIILRVDENLRNQTLFPLIGEIAIDKEDYFVFRSNWDPFYYRKYLKTQKYQPVIGTREPKEEKAFFASKTISIPDIVTLETFPQGIIENETLGNLNQIKNVKQNIVYSEKFEKQKTLLNIDVFTSLALQDFLISDGISEEFIKYINPNFSFGDPILTDDIKNYISQNILSRYVVKDIIFWEKIWNKGKSFPRIQTGLTDEKKIAAGYVTSRNFKTKFVSPDDLNFKLIYNIPLDKNFSIAFTVVLEKK